MAYLQAEHNQPHPGRTREILKNHPEIGTLMTRNPWTFAILVGLITLQVGIAYGIHQVGVAYELVWWQSLLVTVAAAYLIGAFASHCMYVIIHESTHNLIFKSRTMNKVAGVMADLINSFPASMAFRNYHIKHHAHQGDYENDADLASHWEAKLIGNSFFGKAMWLLFFPVFQALRPPRLAIALFEPWVFINMAACLAFDIAIVYFFGLTGLAYFVCSLFFSVGLHPLGARWIQEHYLVQDDQETYSYYGPLNLVALNVGFHNEHHDFPAIPWNNLPKVREMAPEYYNTLTYHMSWSKLLWKFLSDPKMSLYSRAERIGEGNVKLDAQRREAVAA